MLTRLSPLDLLWVAAVPGISEEFLFRGALIPATFPDWCAPAMGGPQTLLPLHTSLAKPLTWLAVCEVRSELEETDRAHAGPACKSTYCKIRAAQIY